MKEKIEKLKKEAIEIQREIKKKTLNYFLAALGFVAGLAWNEAIKSLIEYLFPLNKNALLGKFIYAILLTIVIVLIASYLQRIFKEKEIDL